MHSADGLRHPSVNRALRVKVSLLASAAALLALLACTHETARPAEAPAAWATFWDNFRKAATAQDRQALRSVMAERFDYTFGDGAPGADAAFAFWDRPEIRGWAALSETTSRGAVDYSPPPQWELTGKVKIAPPEATAPDYRGWRAVFEEQPGGWRFVALLQGD